jgi:hypothetical protein
MENSIDRANQFKKELKALLKKYDAEIEIVDNGIAYHEDKIMKVYINEAWHKDVMCISASAEIDLGTNFDGK